MTPEGKVKAYLFKRVKQLGGEIRNVAWIGRSNCPDTRVMLPWVQAWVETKQLTGDARDAQRREFKRMRDLGETVLLMKSETDIDNWLNQRKLDL